ncbi:PAS domain S-box protein [Microbulbifer guangxiensis]|uniref:PAS domain S-box protein n=1 Tax=Microbulbifer guangxiensis TaxID=2904249 RepID=UPI001F2B6E55|nr:PAS domain S-box protein [Microbulbifer guangxiensis]
MTIKDQGKPALPVDVNGETRVIYEALRKSEERYRELVEHANSIILRWDRNGFITFFNEYAQQFFGYSEREIIGRHVVGTIVPENESTGRDLRPLMDEICRDPEAHRYNINENVTRSGKRVWIAWTNKVLKDDDGNLVGVLSIGSDITKQRRLEEELRQAQKMQAIGELAGGIAHDFNNMIHGISGYAEVIRELSDHPQVGEYATHILTTAQHAAELTQQLLTFARKGKYQLRECNTHEIIRDVCAMLARTIDRRIIIEQNLLASRYHILGDTAQLKSALLNLGINAKDAMPDGGMLRLSSRNVEIESPTTISEFELQPGPHLQITISDDGTGMPESVRQRIFEPFFTTKDSGRGAGLGLAAVYGMTHMHQGAIRCHSMEGQGSSFDLFLPIGQVEEKTEGQTRHATGRSKGIRIMVVDDEPMVRNYSKALFEMHGHRVWAFDSAETAIAFYRGNYREIDLVLLDMIMPKMDGQQLFSLLKAINPDINAILSTGYSVESKIESILQDGILECIRKPFTYDQLESLLKRLTAEGRLPKQQAPETHKP